jgi:hypothetical protein
MTNGPIIVTGPGRSGTSAVARVLHKSGLRMGTEFAPANEYNPVGYYEDVPARDLNERVMADCEMDGLDHWPERTDVLRAAEPYRDEMGRIASTGVAGWKDPRFCVTLEAWLPVLSAPPRIVVCLRSPKAFVRSAVSIFGLVTDESLERWWANHLERVLEVIREYRLAATSVVYENLVMRPDATVERLAAFVGRPLDARFVEPSLRQFDEPVPERHRSLYEDVRALR